MISKQRWTLFFVSVLIVGFLLMVYGYFNRPKAVYIESRSAFNRPDVEEEMDRHALQVERIEKNSSHLNTAIKLKNEGKYDEAINECRTALDYTNKTGANAWVTRRILGDIYEKAGKYNLALEELEWAESVQTRPDVLKQLAEERIRLETLLATKAQATQNTQSQNP